MRITNTMMVNTSLLNLNRGLEKLQMYDTQVQTGKKIATASEDPIIASKSIKYSTRLYEIEQYKSNVSSANSWLGSTDTALGTTTSILKRMRELIEQCSTETLSDEDRLSNQVELVELRDQIIQEANSSVAGRYLFSGYKTDQKVMFDTESNKEYHIYESLDYKNSTSTLVDETGTLSSHSVKMTYANASNVTVKIGDETYTEAGTDNCFIVYKSQSDVDAYNPPAAVVDNTVTPPTTTKVIHIINETGEIVFEDAHYNSLTEDIQVEMDKAGFNVGELNPVHYFDCAEKITLSPTRLGTNDTGKLTLNSVGGIKEDSIRGLTINGTLVMNDEGVINAPYTLNYTNSSDLSTLGVNEIRVNMDNGTLAFGTNIPNTATVDVTSYYKAVESPTSTTVTSSAKFKDTNIGNLSSSRSIDINSKGTIAVNSIANLSIGGNAIITNGNPAGATYTVNYTNSSDATAIATNEVRINMDTGEIVCGAGFAAGDNVEIDSFSRTVTSNVREEIQYEVNSNSKLTVNSLASDVFTIDMIKDLDLIINRIQTFDRDEVTTLCGRALTQIDTHLDQILKEEAIVGSKINRLTLVESRLEDDKINFKELKSDNEDIDETEALTNLALQELVYTAAMSATSKILQQSLLDFLN